MNRRELTYYLDYILRAMDQADIPFNSKDEHTEIVEPSASHPLMLLGYNTHCGISIKIELASEYVSFDIELEICDNFLPARFSYQDDFEGKVEDFISLISKAVAFKGNCSDFTKQSKSGHKGS